ncbi:MAG: co-chaperone GroES [Nitrospirae bacterium]|nr:co-chaperone GroES [Nitrospirota bacterium]
MKAKKNLIIVGDRVLIDLDERMEKTNAGLYLPPTVREKEKVQGGYVVKVGPGYPVPDSGATDEPWSGAKKREIKYIPLQAAEGDYAIFLRESAIEIEFESKKYLIVPQSAILALVRTEFTEEQERLS